MRYQIHSLQQRSLKVLGLNTEDALLLDWLLNWKDGDSMERITIENNDIAYWVNYGKVIEELPILFTDPKSNSDEDIEKAKKANSAKVARMLKGNLSKVLTRHERKLFGKTKVYISLNRKMIDFLINGDGNKKASNGGTKEATQKSKKINNSNSSICESDKNNTSNKEKNKQVNNVKEDSEVVKLLKDNKITGIKPSEAEKMFTDTNILTNAIEECISRNKKSYGYLKMVYETKLEEANSASNNMKPRNQQRIEMINNFAKGASSNVNNNFTKYTEKELEEMLQESQNGKFD